MLIRFPAVIELSNLDGSNGFKLSGKDRTNMSGRYVSAVGDINADGVDDIIIGATNVSPNGSYSGQSYVVFGGQGAGSSGTVDLLSLNGSNGFKINGIAAGDYSGRSVSAAGDVNADGVDDLLIGAPHAGPTGVDSGQSYVVFGGVSVGSNGSIELSSLNGSNGFILNGIAAGDKSGISVSAAGDINADGVDDIIIGANNASPNGSSSGQSYVVFGGTNVGSSGIIELSSLNGANGFKLNGIAAHDYSGISVAAVRDINADGVADLIIGASGADPNGQSYVVFGGVSVGSSGTIEFSSLNGSDGFKINGIASGDQCGRSVSAAGDVNADGVDDLIVGARYAEPNGPRSGQSYVVFGGVSVGSSGTIELSSLDGKNGFMINGISQYDVSGQSVATAGDINHDGIADLIIGAPGASPQGANSGQSYVVFGGAGIGSSGTMTLFSLDGSSGFKVNGIEPNDNSGSSVFSAGDINNDGITDIIIGFGIVNNDHSSGQTYVIFGDSSRLVRNELSLTQGQTVVLTPHSVNATSINHDDAHLQFKISNVTQGQFEFISNPGMPITYFFQDNVTRNEVQFVNDWSIASPSYDVTVFTDMWARTAPQAASIHYAPLILVDNEMSIGQGETRILSSTNLRAIDNSNLGAVLFTINNPQHGRFEELSAPGIPITSFIQQKITNEKIQFVHDGSLNKPSYSVIVSDATYHLPPASAAITFDYAPVLETNTLTIRRGETVPISPKNLRATDPDEIADALIFTISALQNGQFEFANTSRSISHFTQGQIASGDVQFIHNGGPEAPRYNVSVSDNIMATASAAALINWDPTQPGTLAPREANHLRRNTLIGAFLSVGFVGTLLLCYMSTGFLQKRRLKEVGKRGTEEQAHFYQTVIIPIAQAVFKRIKVTGFMNYISSTQMEAYVAEIATMVNEINQLGIHIELEDMDSDRKTQLLNEIVKQMERHLGIKAGTCNRAWFASFFKAQVRPEEIGQKAKRIATSVHAALMGIDEPDLDGFELTKMGSLDADVAWSSIGDEEIIDSQSAEIARLSYLLEKRKQEDRTENERLRALLNQQAADGSFNSTTSYVKLA